MSQQFPREQLPFTAGRGVNDRKNPHRIHRPGGTDVWIFEYAVSGQGWLRLHGQSRAINPGDILLFRPGAPQYYGMDEHVGAWDHLWVCFMPHASWLEWLTWPEFAPGIFALTAPEALRPRLRARLEEMNAIARGAWKRRREFTMNALEEVLLWCDTFNPNSQQARQDPRIRHLQEVICTRYADSLTLADLADETGLSVWRLAHLCKEHTGYSPMQLLTAHRVARAAELLLMTEKSVTEIATDTGFPDPFYFSRIFHRQRGMSPRDFRARNSFMSE